MADFNALRDEVKADWLAHREWRDQAEKDFAFVAGHQWDDEALTALKASNRAALTFNRVATIINAVAGTEINNRTEVRFLPREIGDVRPNEVLSAGAKWFRDQADAEDNESQSFEDMLTTGLGWTETTLDYDDDEEGAPKVERVDPREMVPDRAARKKGLTDGQRVTRVRRLPLDRVREMFPDKSAEEIDASWMEVASEPDVTLRDVKGDRYAEPGDDTAGEDDDGLVTVVQTQWREREEVVEYLDAATGKPAEMPAGKWRVLTQRAPDVAAIPHRKKSRFVWRQAFLGSSEILLENQPCATHATFQAITGRWDAKDRRWYGLLRMMTDPQKFANKWISQVLHIINTNAKGGVLAETDAVDNHKAFEEDWAAADAVQWLRPGAIAAGKVREKAGAQFPAALMQLTEYAADAIRGTSGVNLEILGLRDANQPGVLEYQRRQSAMTTLAAYFDALRFYRKRQGHVILYILTKHIAPTGRLVRIVREDQVAYIPLAMDAGAQKFDVIVDDAPSAPNEKERAWSVIERIMPLLMQSGLDAETWADILEYSPLPSSFAEKLRERAGNPQPPDPMREAALAKEQADAAQKQSAAVLNQARAQQIGAEAATAPQRSQAELIKAYAEAMSAQTEARMAPMRANIEAMTGAASARKADAEARFAPMRMAPFGSAAGGR